jgi:hypothetical protein
MAGSLVGQLMATRGSVYVDEESSSLFGTLRFGAATSLNGVPWQHFGSSIICRFDVENAPGRIRFMRVVDAQP